MNNYDIRTKPYDLLVELFHAKDKGETTRGLMTSKQINNLSFELLLFYLMFVFVYLNDKEVKKINPIIGRITNYLDIQIRTEKLNIIYNINRIQLSYQSLVSYKKTDTFSKLYDGIVKLPKSIKIHKYYIDFLVFLNNFIILNNRISSSIRTTPKIKDIKKKIREIFSIIVDFTHESHRGNYIHIEEEILNFIKYKLYELMKIFNSYHLESPLQCLEQTKCTDIIFVDSLQQKERQHTKNFENDINKIFANKK